MSYLFVSSHGASINYDANYIVVNYGKQSVRHIPVETLEAIYIFSSVQITPNV